MLPVARNKLRRNRFCSSRTRIRCFVPGCDDPDNPNLDEPWVQNVIPGHIDATGLFTAEQCERFRLPHEHTANHTAPTDQCRAPLPTKTALRCDRWVFDKNEKTIVNEWLITCKENQYLLSLVGTAHFAGIVTGSAAAGVLADK